MKSLQPRISRRSFLFGATATAAATAAVIGRNKSPDHALQQGSAQPQKGYQLSAHVRNYYRTAMI